MTAHKGSSSDYIQVIAQLLTKFGASLGKLEQPLPVIIFGGVAVHFYTESRISMDVDIDFMMRRVFLDENMSVQYIQDGISHTIVIDRTYTPVLGPVQEDYIDRATPFSQECGSNLLVMVASPVDLAISKLGRFAEHDQEDIRNLIECGLLEKKEFEELATDAISVYVGRVEPVITNMKKALDFFPQEKHVPRMGK